jgi:mRNA interferase MazF
MTFNEGSDTVLYRGEHFHPTLISTEPRAGFPLTFELSDASLPKKSWIKISQIRTLSIKRIGKKTTRISPEELAGILAGLNEIIGG